MKITLRAFFQVLILLTGTIVHAALDPDKALSIGIVPTYPLSLPYAPSYPHHLTPFRSSSPAFNLSMSSAP